MDSLQLHFLFFFLVPFSGLPFSLPSGFAFEFGSPAGGLWATGGEVRLRGGGSSRLRVPPFHSRASFAYSFMRNYDVSQLYLHLVQSWTIYTPLLLMWRLVVLLPCPPLSNLTREGEIYWTCGSQLQSSALAHPLHSCI